MCYLLFWDIKQNNASCVTDEMSCLCPWQIVKPLCEFFGVTQNLLKNMADIIPYCTKVVHIVPPCDRNVILSNYIMYAPCPLSPQGQMCEHNKKNRKQASKQPDVKGNNQLSMKDTGAIQQAIVWTAIGET